MTVRRGGSDRCAITDVVDRRRLHRPRRRYRELRCCQPVHHNSRRPAGERFRVPTFVWRPRRIAAYHPYVRDWPSNKGGRSVFFIDVVVSASVRLVVAQTAEANLRPELNSRNERLWKFGWTRADIWRLVHLQRLVHLHSAPAGGWLTLSRAGQGLPRLTQLGNEASGRLQIDQSY
jgi:hypothetical protein